MSDKNSSKNILLSVIGIAVLIIVFVGVTFAFFNYTRTGSSNVIKVGRISFVTRQTETINLTNVFPIDKTTINTDTDNVDEVVIEIEGDTDYSDGIEYLVSSVDSNIYTTSGVLVPISLDVTTTGLGNNNPNYFTARDSKDTTMYKKIVGDTLVGDGMLLVGYIKKNTTSGTAEGVDGSITIKAYFDKDKIKISDTYDGTESDNMGSTNEWAEGKTVITTSEWNALQQNGVSFKVKVEANEGIWVNGSLEEIMRKSTVMDNTTSTYVTGANGIDFSTTSSNINGKGVYTRAGTENDTYPIMYYRGDIEDNNVLFANQCWKAVRTTDTGGVKLIYNGIPAEVYEKVDLSENDYTIISNAADIFTFNSTDNTWTGNSVNEVVEFSFKVPAGENYTFELEGTLGQPESTNAGAGGSFAIYKGTSSVTSGGGNSGAEVSNIHIFETLTENDVIKFTFSGGGFSTLYPNTFKIKMTQRGESLGIGCDNSATATQISINGTNTFPFSGTNLYKSPAYNGYMYGTVYEWTNDSPASGAYFGNGFEWDGTNYSLTNAKVGFDGTHHYTCNLTSSMGTCANIRYYFQTNYYVTLTDGESIEDALTKMQTNTTSSNAKIQIETWYGSNMTSYTDKLEDVIWCNDRSISSKGGWNPNGYSTDDLLWYSPSRRYDTPHELSLACANKNDSFTWKNTNGNQKLNYPVAMLTMDEMILAGGAGNTGSFYLNSGSNIYWSMSPHNFGINYSYATEFGVDTGLLRSGNVDRLYGLRPAISIKPGQLITNGTGTVADPYVIE